MPRCGHASVTLQCLEHVGGIARPRAASMTLGTTGLSQRAASLMVLTGRCQKRPIGRDLGRHTRFRGAGQPRAGLGIAVSSAAADQLR